MELLHSLHQNWQSRSEAMWPDRNLTNPSSPKSSLLMLCAPIMGFNFEKYPDVALWDGILLRCWGKLPDKGADVPWLHESAEGGKICFPVTHWVNVSTAAFANWWIALRQPRRLSQQCASAAQLLSSCCFAAFCPLVRLLLLRSAASGGSEC